MINFYPSVRVSFRDGVARLIFILIALFLLLAGGVKAYAAPAAGTVIGNQATATYQDTTGTSRTTSSNLVQTTVSQVKSFTLTADGAKTAAPGQTVYYPHTITNTGNGTDTLALNAPTSGGTFAQTGLAYYLDANGDGVPDSATPITSTGPLPAGTQFKFVVAASVPGGATAGQTGTVVISATDTGTTTLSNTDTTTVANSVINVTKSLSSITGASPSTGPITVTLAFTNSGTSAANSVVLTDALPSGMIYVANSGRWSVSGTTALGDGAGGDPAGINYSFTGGTVLATITSVSAGVSGTVSFQVNIAAGLAPTTGSNAAVTTNTASFATGTQATANTNSATYSVAATASVVANGSPTVSADGTAEPVTVASAAQGSTIVFNDYIWNTGNGTDSFNAVLSGSNFPAGTTFALFQSDGLTPLLDSNGDGIPDTGPLAAGAVNKVVVVATLPAAAPAGGGPFSVTLTATSNTDPTKSNPVLNTLTTITANTVDLTNNVSVAGGATVAQGLGSTGATVITTNLLTASTTVATQSKFQLYVNNTSTVADSYNLSLTSAIPTGWSVTFAADGGGGACATTGAALTNTGTIAATGNRLVCAIVNVPATNSNNATAGNYDFTFRVQSAVTATAFDTKVDRVTVNALHNVTLTPNGAQQTFPGGSVTYTHVLKNNGNVNETITFPAGFLTDSQIAAGWTSVLYIDSNGTGVLEVGTDTQVTTLSTLPLLTNASSTLFVRVFAPASATAASAADVTTVTATYNAGASSATASDTTSVTDGLLLQKGQAAVSCSAPGPFVYSTAAIAAGANTAPGQCIAYQISASNTTAASITNVVLSDNIPANTTRNDACGAPAATNGATVGGTSANATTGTVTASLTPLASTASFALTFCVRINP